MPAGPMPWRNRWCWCSPARSPPPPASPSQPDKTAIKEALKAGHLIPGAQLVSRRSWRIH
ncbi:siphovirus Gp157 family protein [Synechococcus sp. BSF8S]|uniref:siphovirus Gp157 family protein n=2 Tax=unclassified Synechococcus TaxID=2626047 RepID=UPI002107A963|nr:siphovirus Gp157 family protein [Synechococcus sp. BSF8S]